MQNLRPYRVLLKTCVILFAAELFFFGSAFQFAAAYIAAFFFLALRALSSPSKKRMKLIMIFSYGALLFLQISFNDQMAAHSGGLEWRRLFGVAAVLFPFAVERFFTVNKNNSFYYPSVQEITAFSFHELRQNREKILALAAEIRNAGKALSIDNVRDLVSDIPRNNSFRYINNGSLTEAYFMAARDALDDPGLYIVVSSTGSAASEVISIFTKKQYNHASLSFDAELKTTISYNGGNRVYPPGLNPEMLEYFQKKPDASILVYRLEATRAQKERILEQIYEINENGSAYNVLGLFIKYQHKSNILFCSQFVYKMLKHAGLQYFTKNDADVKPMDFVELDMYRKLSFVYEIKFSPEDQAPSGV